MKKIIIILTLIVVYACKSSNEPTFVLVPSKAVEIGIESIKDDNSNLLINVYMINHQPVSGIQFEIDLYKFFRRFVILAFIIFELAAQALLIKNLVKIKNKIGEMFNKKILIAKIFVVSVLIIVGVLSLPILTSSGYVHFKHALECNYFLGVIIFYLFTFLFWRKIPLS